MPFTPAHAIVALPFVRTPLVPAAIAVGAMAPDVPLFFRFGPSYWVTHSWIGVVTVDVLLALALLIVWRVVLRPAVPELTPRWFARRWPAVWSDSNSGWWELWGGRSASTAARWRTVGLLAVALVIGAATHLIWDAFTHEGRWGSALIPQLDDQLGPFRLYAWGHYGSSIVSLAIISVWGLGWLRRQIPSDREFITPGWMRVAVWLALPVSLLVGALVVAVFRAAPHVSGLQPFLERSGTTGAAIFLVVLAFLALLVRIRMPRHARDAP